MGGRVDLPEELAAMAAGAGLSAALHSVPLDAVPNDRMLDVVRAQYRLLCHEQARMEAVLVELARCTDASTPGAVSRRCEPDPWAVHETRAALCWTRSAAEAEHSLAEFVHGRLPQVFAAWLAGSIDRPRVRVFEQYLVGLWPEQIASVCAVAVPQAPGLTTGQLAALLRRLVIAVDPDAAARWYRQRLRERSVCAYLTSDGTVTITAQGLPPDEAEAACQRVERLAAAAKRTGCPATIDQLRTDTFLGLLDGRFHHSTDDEIIAALLDATHRACTAVATHADPQPDPGNTDPEGTGPEGADPGRTGPDPDRAVPEEHGPRGCSTDGSGTDQSDPDDPGPDRTDEPGPRPHRPGCPRPRSGTDTDRRRGIEIRVALPTLLGLDDHPGEIPGLGPVLAPITRARVALQTRAEWRFAVIGPDGALLSEGITRHRPTGSTRTGSPPGGIVEIQVPVGLLCDLIADPSRAGVWADIVADIGAQHRDYDQHVVDLDARPADRLPRAAQRRHTEIRDRTCTFAGVCRRPAHACAQDHRHDHARGGATVSTNLGPVCAHDHELKHRTGWTVTPDRPGVVTWHSPLGGHYPSRGEFLCTGLPDPPAARVVEGPILRRPPPPTASGPLTSPVDDRSETAADQPPPF